MKIETICPICGKHSHFNMTLTDYTALLHGGDVNKIFPHLPKEERIAIIDGTCTDCQKKERE